MLIFAIEMNNNEHSKYKQLSFFPELESKENGHAIEPVSCSEAQQINDALQRLSHSRFRSSFYLNKADKAYIESHGWDKIAQGTADIIARRLAPAEIANDGRQTPMRHGIFPPFIAQHATACCCRGCLQKWYGIPKGRPLSASEQHFVVSIIMQWLRLHASL